MKSSYQRRLFRVFLFLSIVPAMALTIAGYYLTAEDGFRDPDHSTITSQATDYYNDYLFNRIEQALISISEPSGLLSDRLDFLFVYDNEQIDAVKMPEILTEAIAEEIIRAGLVRSRGFVDADQRLYQFVSSNLDSSSVVFAGVVHDGSYTRLLQAVRQETSSRSLARRLRSEYALFLTLLFVTLSALVVGAAYLLSSRLSRNLARPLHELSEASKKIAQGDFQQQVQPSGEGEMQVLINNFNQMARQLDQTTVRLAQSERVAAWRQVAQRFAHELKNPLQPLLISLFRIEKQLSNSESYETVREPLKAASEEAQHLKKLADRFSQLAKLPPPTIAQLDLCDLVRSVVELYRGQMDENQFQISLPKEPMLVRTDAACLREALHNLLQNAIDATGDDRIIKLRLTCEDARILISISDNGAGMDSKTISRARLPYFTTRQEGSGLGLAIVEKSIGDLGGQITIDSRPGQGTTVTIVLPQEK
jgi:nitrogen fixation/metabolism regulation signal transduction histidine kinase